MTNLRGIPRKNICLSSERNWLSDSSRPSFLWFYIIITWQSDIITLILTIFKLMTELLKNGNDVKMIDFLKAIQKKYKVLNRLNETESRDFQAELVNLLVD